MIADRYVPQPRHRQHGVALIMAMVFLMILTIIGVTVMSTTSLQEKMAGNAQDKHSAFQAAESALRDAEALVETWVAKPTTFTANTGGYYMPQTGDLQPWWETVDWTPGGSGTLQLASTMSGLATQPTFIIEDLGQLAGASGGTASIVAGFADRKSTRLNSSHMSESRMPSSA